MTRGDAARLRAFVIWLYAVVAYRSAFRVVALGFDWDEILMLCTALGAAAYIVMEWRRVSRLDEYALDFAERMGAVEAAIGGHNPHSIDARVAAIESALETFDPVEMRERMATVESRIDHKPITLTRCRGGKFASPQAMLDEIERLTAELAKRGTT